jgi:hypothetical protein
MTFIRAARDGKLPVIRDMISKFDIINKQDEVSYYLIMTIVYRIDTILNMSRYSHIYLLSSAIC